jgi:hypothetical protein
MGAVRLRQRVCKGHVVSASVAVWLLGGVVLSQTEVPSQPLSAPENTPATGSATDELPQPAAENQPPAPPAVQQAFVGTNQCFVCHRPQTNTWSETSHAQAFTHLPEIYRSNSECLKCHATGFGDPSGYVAGSDKDLLMVGCESCHGPGAQHIDAAKRFVLASGPAEEAQIEKEMRATIVKSPADEICISCHKTQAHGSHPPYRGTLPAPAAVNSAKLTNSMTTVTPRFSTAISQTRYVPGYSVKTCGSCHYDQYLNWRTEKHSALAESLPAKYAADQNCTNCHTTTGLASATSTTDVHHSLLGVACESCHGPALEHVRFNVKFIHSPPLGTKLEQEARQSIRQGRPSTACVQCHVGQSHKEHPRFEAN